ncbi:MAG: hypothetical protein JST00_14140 [Deltaproteobacteria bacterium]|nr:hypothetical protein [Deltaproteobacteria bacterium]
MKTIGTKKRAAVGKTNKTNASSSATRARANGRPAAAEITRAVALSSATEPRGDLGAAAATKPTYEARMRALAPVVRLRKKLEATAKRFSKIANEVKRWRNAPDLGAKASTVEATLAAMLGGAATLPDAFEPERERKGSARQLAAGAEVVLREKVAAKYAGLLETEPGASLEVVAVTRGHVSVRTTAGALVVLRRAQITRASARPGAMATSHAG